MGPDKRDPLPGPSHRGPRGRRGVLAERIVRAARRSFAEHGYAATTLRRVAADAEVDMALVSYYFGSKGGLLEAALAPPEGFLDQIAQAAATPLPERGAALVVAMVGMWDDPDLAEILRSMILTADHIPVAMDRLRTLFASSILLSVSDQLDDPERFLRASLVASQMVGLAMTRYVWRVGPIATIPSAQVVTLVGPNVQRYLSGLL